ncbi:MAG: tetratricopeptide repeat protein [Saprospiraceae bacterium]|nr:tetratricopeptide repeat protein [Saprospiraceae bacterium]
MKIFTYIFICTILVTACQEKGNNLFKDNQALKDAAAAYDAESNPQNANLLLKEVMEELATLESEDPRTNELLEYGYNVAKENSIHSREAAFLFPLVRDQLGQDGTEEKIYDLAVAMKKMNKETAANTLFKGIMENYPDYAATTEAASLISVEIDTIDNYLTELGTKIFENPDNTGVNRQASLRFVDACEAYATAYHTSSAAPEYLFKAAEVAKSIRTFTKSLAIYDWIIEKYPDYNKTATSLFLKGFIIENNLGDDDKAREVYNEFLEKYPEHDLADDIEFLLENLGKTDEEILQMIEERRKQQENPS